MSEDPALDGAQQPITTEPSGSGRRVGPADPARAVEEHQAPLAAVRSDVGRIAAFFRSIHSRYLWAGILVYLATAVFGVVLAVVAPARDWFMHLAMYLVVFVFILFYVRAHIVHRRFARAFYAVVALALAGFFAWVLVDLVPARLEVVGGDLTRPDGSVIPGPTVIERPATPAFLGAAALLCLTALWLAFHWLVLSRFRHEPADDEAAALS